VSFEEYCEIIHEFNKGNEVFHCVEFFRKVKDKMYKEANGIPADEETEYIERVRTIEDARYDAFLKSKGISELHFVM
jgi:hypothetical protein